MCKMHDMEWLGNIWRELKSTLHVFITMVCSTSTAECDRLVFLSFRLPCILLHWEWHLHRQGNCKAWVALATCRDASIFAVRQSFEWSPCRWIGGIWACLEVAGRASCKGHPEGALWQGDHGCLAATGDHQTPQAALQIESGSGASPECEAGKPVGENCPNAMVIARLEDDWQKRIGCYEIYLITMLTFRRMLVWGRWTCVRMNNFTRQKRWKPFVHRLIGRSRY